MSSGTKREVIAELANLECPLICSLRSIGLIEQWLREGHKRFCNGAHVQVLRVVAPNDCRTAASRRPVRAQQGVAVPRRAARFYRGKAEK